MRNGIVPVIAALFVGCILGATVIAALDIWSAERQCATYAEMRRTLDSLQIAQDSLAIDVDTCRYHVNRAHGRMSTLESDVATWLRRNPKGRGREYPHSVGR